MDINLNAEDLIKTYEDKGFIEEEHKNLEVRITSVKEGNINGKQYFDVFFKSLTGITQGMATKKRFFITQKAASFIRNLALACGFYTLEPTIMDGNDVTVKRVNDGIQPEHFYGQELIIDTICEQYDYVDDAGNKITKTRTEASNFREKSREFVSDDLDSIQVKQKPSKPDLTF